MWRISIRLNRIATPKSDVSVSQYNGTAQSNLVANYKRVTNVSMAEHINQNIGFRWLLPGFYRIGWYQYMGILGINLFHLRLDHIVTAWAVLDIWYMPSKKSLMYTVHFRRSCEYNLRTYLLIYTYLSLYCFDRYRLSTCFILGR